MNRRGRFKPGRARSQWIVLATAALVTPASAFAQTAPTPQRGGTVSDQFDRPALPVSQPIAPFRIDRPRAGQATDAIRFAVRRVVVEGAAVLDPATIGALTAPLAGRIVSLADLAAVADRITSSYAARGYALSFAIVPEQDVADGMVRIRVVEGSIDDIQVEFRDAAPLVGRQRIEATVRRRLRGLVATGPVRTAELERAVLGIDDLSGLAASVVVRPSAKTEGAATLAVIIGSTPIDAAAGIDNRLRSEFGREEIYLTGVLNSALFVGDRLDVSSRRAIENDAFEYAAIGYETSLGDSLARVYGGYSLARTEAQRGILGLLEFRGREETFRIGARHALIRSRARSLYVSGELGGIDTRSSLFGVSIVRENIRTATLGVAYDWADGGGSQSLFAANFVQGLEGLGASDAANPARTRAQGRPDARYATIRYYRDQALPSDFRLRLDSQLQFLIGAKSLLAASECTFGGPALGRAYDAGALSGDECWRFSGEVARRVPIVGQTVEPYAFVDYGKTRQRGILEAGERRTDDAVSYGAGLRLFTSIGVTADVQASVPARRLFAGDDRKPRLFFQLSYQR